MSHHHTRERCAESEMPKRKKAQPKKSAKKVKQDLEDQLEQIRQGEILGTLRQEVADNEKVRGAGFYLNRLASGVDKECSFTFRFLDDSGKGSIVLGAWLAGKGKHPIGLQVQ